MKVESPDWRPKVYHPSKAYENDGSYDLYKMTLKSLARRLHCICEGCRKKYSQGKLAIHHIIPRPEGTDDPNNLILLCHKCHDLAEEYGQGTRKQIVCYIQDEIIKTQTIENKKVKIGKNWHEWVYGGRRNPQLEIEYKPRCP